MQTCLCTGHEVSLGLHYRNGVFLDRGWPGVAAQSDVAHDDLSHVHILELFNQETARFRKNTNRKQVMYEKICYNPKKTAAAYALDVVRTVLSSSFNRNVIVFLKIDPSVTAGEQLTKRQKKKKRINRNSQN